MKNIAKNQAGFGMLEMFVILLILIVVGFGGYRIYQNRNENKTTSSSTSSSTNSNTSQSAATDTLTIKEWGMKVTIPAELGTVNYATDGDSAVTFSSTLQKTLPTTCSASTQASGPWGISRTNEANTTSDEKSFLTHSGDYYYRRVYPQQGCEEGGDLVTKVDSAYNTMFKSLATE